MSGKLEKTINSVYGVPTKTGMGQLVFNDTTVASGELEADSVYKMVANNDFHYALLEDGQAPLSAGQGLNGFYVASGQNEFFSTDKNHHTLSVIRAKTGGTVYYVKLTTRGI